MINNPLDHKSVCSGGLICVKCKRPACEGCLENNNLCVICNGTWKPGSIILHNKPLSEWNE